MIITKIIVRFLNYIKLKFYQSIFGKRNYTKFCIISRSRTGSNLLISLLNSNPDIKAHGEKFGKIGNKENYEVLKEIFPKKAIKKAIGFKIFYYHPIDSDDKGIWDFLRRNKNIKIIHLQRRNLIRIHLSRLIAIKTKSWSTNLKNEINLNSKKVKIEYDDLRKDIKKTEKWIEDTNKKYRKNQILEIFYEDLVTKPKKTLSEIYSFIGVSNHKSETKLQKQNPEKIKDLVLNYDEIEMKLVKTAYAHMLIDGEN